MLAATISKGVIIVNINPSAVSSANLGSRANCAICVIHPPLGFEEYHPLHTWIYDYDYDYYYACCQGEHHLTKNYRQ